MEDYMEDSDATLASVGLDSGSSIPKAEKIPSFMCEVCCEDDPDLETYAMRCEDRFCVGCYRHYLEQKIREEGEAARIQCPQSGCKRIVDSRTVEFLVSDDTKKRSV